MLVASFAGVALLLSMIGIYGVMGYYVQQHLKEISIRMALGGSRCDVARLVSAREWRWSIARCRSSAPRSRLRRRD